ncbi:hypothetical protein [Mesomycoplasma molare]|uniref:Uncharacterized protein n=1 Tax=Mesomycoplasma molare TaxID=171288 RepID=A0ABY5TTQ5_9BACT|nr:hypothetical protein [Mesomycoplasma molare]UWD34048.1 hypothetical protein NX772_02995 [Mesomycoplasma molare]
MITALIIWILTTVDASAERLADLLPKIEDIKTIHALQELGVYSFFDTLGKLNKAVFWLVLAIEGAIEFTLLLKYLPIYLSKKFERIRNRSIHDAEIIKAIKYKLENNIILTKKEEKFYFKKIAKKENNNGKK